MKIQKMAEKTFFSLPELALAGVKLNTCARHEAVRHDKCCPSHQSEASSVCDRLKVRPIILSGFFFFFFKGPLLPKCILRTASQMNM